MRISDWSSDVCSSDLRSGRAARGGGRAWPPDRLRCPAAGRGRMTKAHNVDAQRLSFILNELRLPAIRVIWPEFTERADKEGWPATRLLAALTEHEMAERDRRRIERHLSDARLPPGKTLDSFAFDAVPMVSRAQVTAMTSGDGWLEKGANLILFGP